MTTANSIIRDAMIEIGAIGTVETPDPDDAALALRILNRVVEGLSVKGIYSFHTAAQVVTLTAAMVTRTIGPGGQINATRPLRVEHGSFVRISGVDTPLRIATRDEWAGISMKTNAGAPPALVYYEAASPLGILHFWPQAACEAHLMLAQRLGAFADLATDYTLAPGYEEMYRLGLAEKLCRPFTRPVPVDLKVDAANARNIVKLANFQVPELDLPSGRSFGGMAEFNAG